MLVTTGSITTATRLVRILSRDSEVSARVIQAPAQLKKGGCSYAVRYNENDHGAVRDAIDRYRLPVKKFYREGITAAGHEYHAVS